MTWDRWCSSAWMYNHKNKIYQEDTFIQNDIQRGWHQTVSSFINQNKNRLLNPGCNLVTSRNHTCHKNHSSDRLVNSLFWNCLLVCYTKWLTDSSHSSAALLVRFPNSVHAVGPRQDRGSDSPDIKWENIINETKTFVRTCGGVIPTCCWLFHRAATHPHTCAPPEMAPAFNQQRARAECKKLDQFAVGRRKRVDGCEQGHTVRMKS